MAEEYAALSAALQQQSTNEWNKFQHEHGGKGWSKQQMQQKYKSTLKAEMAKGSKSHTATTLPREQMIYQKCHTRGNVSPAAAAAEKQPLS